MRRRPETHTQIGILFPQLLQLTQGALELGRLGPQAALDAVLAAGALARHAGRRILRG